MSKEKLKQDYLFQVESLHDEHWKGMPDFHMEDMTSHRKIVVHFRNDSDFAKFTELMGQGIGPKQPSIWYPEMPNRKASHLIYTYAANE